jgi:transitional endoplasmic reticulum ATPase
MFKDFFQDFFGQGLGQSFGLGEIKLQVVSTSPAGIVKITDMTQVELLPEAMEITPEQNIPTVMLKTGWAQRRYYQSKRTNRAASKAS